LVSHSVSSRRGVAAVEYAITSVAVILLISAAGFVLLPRQMPRLAALLSNTLGGERTALDSTTRPSSLPSPATVQRSTDDRVTLDATVDTKVYVPGGLLIAAAAAVLSLLFVRRRRRRKAFGTVRASAVGPASPAAFQIRAFSKRQQLWRALLTDGELLLKNGMKVRHLMTRDPLTISPKATLSDIRQIIATTRVHHLLVCDGDRLLGVISDRDLCGCDKRSAAEIMCREVHWVTPSTGLGSAIHTLIEKNISCLPVLEGERLCGILSTTDLVLTLQCSLQLWLRMAQTMCTGGTPTDLEALSEALRHEVTAQHERLAELRALLVPGERDKGERSEEAFTAQATRFVMAASRTAAQLDAFEERMRHHTDQWLGLSDPRMDWTTGLANRREMEAVLKLLLGVRKHYGQDFSLVLIGIEDEPVDSDLRQERFRTAVRLIAETMRSTDFAARLEGNTFAVVLTQTSGEGAQIFCERLQAAAAGLEQTSPIAFQLIVPDLDEPTSPAALLDQARSLVAESASPADNAFPLSTANGQSSIELPTIAGCNL